MAGREQHRRGSRHREARHASVGARDIHVPREAGWGTRHTTPTAVGMRIAIDGVDDRPFDANESVPQSALTTGDRIADRLDGLVWTKRSNIRYDHGHRMVRDRPLGSQTS